MYLASAKANSTSSLRQPTTAGIDDLMSQMGVSLAFDRDEEIYGQEEDADLIYRVVKGAVRTSRLMSDGRRQIGDFYYPGDVFGVEPEHELRRSHDHVLLLGRKTACEKVASFLMSVLNRSSTGDAHLIMGRQDMADYLGLTIETVSRMLTQLQTSNVIKFTGLREFQVRNRQSLSRLAA
jgi:CRP/FNR family nitrogen fixation transcriptional regulator